MRNGTRAELLTAALARVTERFNHLRFSDNEMRFSFRGVVYRVAVDSGRVEEVEGAMLRGTNGAYFLERLLNRVVKEIEEEEET